MDAKQVREQLDTKRGSNKRAYMDLIRMGAELDPMAVLMMRQDTLIELIMTEEQRETFELIFEQRLGRAIESAKIDLRKETISKPVKRSGLILPND